MVSLNFLKGLLIALGIVLLGACGFLGMSCAAALYADHQLLNAIRANSVQQQAEQAEAIKRYQAQQAQPALPPAAVAPAK